jgi:hypothetical protein
MKQPGSDAPAIIENGRLICDFERRMRAAASDENRAVDPPLVPIKRCPTRLLVRCPACGNSATITIMLDDVPKLTCSKCGRSDPSISGRSPLSAWARVRHKQNHRAHAAKNRKAPG